MLKHKGVENICSISNIESDTSAHTHPLPRIPPRWIVKVRVHGGVGTSQDGKKALTYVNEGDRRDVRERGGWKIFVAQISD